MKTIDRIISFAEKIAMEDDAKMKRIEAWENFIKPLFKEHTGYEFNPCYVNMYRKEWKQWIDVKRKEFNKTYCA